MRFLFLGFNSSQMIKITISLHSYLIQPTFCSTQQITLYFIFSMHPLLQTFAILRDIKKKGSLDYLIVLAFLSGVIMIFFLFL